MYQVAYASKDDLQMEAPGKGLVGRKEDGRAEHLESA